MLRPQRRLRQIRDKFVLSATSSPFCVFSAAHQRTTICPISSHVQRMIVTTTPQKPHKALIPSGQTLHSSNTDHRQRTASAKPTANAQSVCPRARNPEDLVVAGLRVARARPPVFRLHSLSVRNNFPKSGSLFNPSQKPTAAPKVSRDNAGHPIFELHHSSASRSAAAADCLPGALSTGYGLVHSGIMTSPTFARA